MCMSILCTLTIDGWGAEIEHPAALDPTRPPGRIVDIGSHRLHIWCKGNNLPTVVIDSGVGGFSLEWSVIQANLSTELRVCTYDRAGYGWSDAGPTPRSTDRIVNELQQLLTLAEVPNPYLLVGHSFGGYTAQYFAKIYPQVTAGIVLVDSSHPNQFADFPILTPTIEPTNGHRKFFSRARLPDNFPERQRDVALLLMRTAKAISTHRMELLYLQRSGALVAKSGALPDIPVQVLTRGRRVWPDSAEGDRREQAWRRLQKELAGLNDHGEQRVATSSGHYIHLDQPRLVEDAIRTVARQVSGVRPLR